jgi:hypothetical protein
MGRDRHGDSERNLGGCDIWKLAEILAHEVRLQTPHLRKQTMRPSNITSPPHLQLEVKDVLQDNMEERSDGICVVVVILRLRHVPNMTESQDHYNHTFFLVLPPKPVDCRSTDRQSIVQFVTGN